MGFILGTALALFLTGGAANVQAEAQADRLLMRLTVLEPVVTDPESLDAAVQLLVMHRDPWHPRRFLRFDGLQAGVPSAWMNTESLLDAQTGVATVAIRLSAAGKSLSVPARVQVELSRDGRTVPAMIVVSDPKAVMGFEVPERRVPDASLAARLRSIREIAERHVEATAPFAVADQDRPRHFIAASRPTVFYGYTDRAIASNEVHTLLNLGFNTMVNLPLDLAVDLGVPYVAGAEYRPAGINQAHPDREAVSAHYRKRADPFRCPDGSTSRLRAFAMSDEPALDFPRTTDTLARDPQAVALFHAYLRERELEPSMLGGQTWDDILPAGPPDADADVARRLLWFHSARFAVQDQSRRYAVAADALRREMGDQVLGFVNWNNPGIFFSDVSQWHRNAPLTASHDWFEFSRLGGSTCLWMGPGVSESGGWYRSTFRTWSMMLSILRSAAAEGVGRFGAYVHHQFIPDHRGYEAALSILAIAGQGGAGYNAYVWGPHYAFTEYMWSERFGHYPHVADANRLVGRSEYLMAKGRPPEAQIAILWPVTSQIHELNQGGYWTYNRDYLVEAQHVWMALNRRHLPVDFVDETMVRRGLPGHYRVLYVVGPNLESGTAPALTQWVRSGGILWSSARAVLYDEINRPTSALDAVLGVSAREVTRAPVDDVSPRRGLQRLGPMGTVTMNAPGGEGTITWENCGARSRLTPVTGAEVAGWFEDETPAVIRHSVGDGVSWHFAGMPGLAYGRGARERDGKPTTGYPETVGNVVAAVADAAGVRRPARADRPSVETAVLRSDRGMAVSLLHWEAQPIASLEVVIAGVDRLTRLRSARLGTLDFRHENGDVYVQLPMPEVIDVLLLDF